MIGRWWWGEEGMEESKWVFILAGQSNMAGRGGVGGEGGWDGVVPEACNPHPLILRLNSELQWEQAHDPLHSDIDTTKTCGVGPAMSFSNSLLSSLLLPSPTIGLVPCALGGTSISHWAPGLSLFNSMVARASSAVAGGSSTILAAILWFQGESDTSAIADASAYKCRLESLIFALRSELRSPSLPFILVAIASGVDERLVEVVRDAQTSILLPNVVCVDAKGLPLKDDGLHLTTDAQVALGQMLALSYIRHFCPP